METKTKAEIDLLEKEWPKGRKTVNKKIRYFCGQTLKRVVGDIKK